jgi:hypothetical protein
MAQEALSKLLADAGGDKEKVGMILNEHGRLAHGQMQSSLHAVFGNISGTASHYIFCMAEALVWAEYAAKVRGYYEKIVLFLEGQATESEIDWNEFAGRHGPAALRNACRGYLEFKRITPKHVAEGKATAKELLDFQNSALIRAIDLSKRGWLPNFGTWLFCGPFKIAAIMNTSIWNEPSLQSLFMPLGCHVGRGFRKLFLQGIPAIVPSLLVEKDAGLADGGFSTLVIAQSFQSDLAKHCEGRVLHINTGLHQLGGGYLCS